VAKKKDRLAVGVDLGGTSLYAAVVDTKTGEIFAEAKRKTKAERGAVGVTARVVKTIEKAIAQSGVKRKWLVGVGIGVPGPIDAASGIVIRLTNMGPTWDGFPLAQTLERHLKLPVVLENDVNVGAVGEHSFGAGRGTADMVALFVGTGLGGGVILGGKLHTGFRGSAGEVGHMLVCAGGEVCGCGERGHAEAYASRTAIEREIRKAIAAGEASMLAEFIRDGANGPLTSKYIEQAHEAGDPVTVRAIESAQYHLGLLIADCVNLLDPEAIVVGGGVLERMGDAYLEPVRGYARQHFINKQAMETIRIVAAELGDSSGAVGAAVQAVRRLRGVA
jgi:glucokinase